MRILILDDAADYRELVAKMYRLRGHDVVDVPNGALAIKAITDGPAFDLIISDYDFGMFDTRNGVEIITELRELTGPDTRYAICSGNYRTIPEWAGFVSKSDIDGLIALAAAPLVTS
jgi:CheY-like chemotaxis protein